MEIYNEFEVEYLDNIKQYVFDNWDRLVIETKRRKEAMAPKIETGIELVPQYEKVEIESIPSQPEPQIEVLAPIVEQVKAEEIKAEIKPIVESNSILDFNDYEFKEKCLSTYRLSYPSCM